MKVPLNCSTPKLAFIEMAVYDAIIGFLVVLAAILVPFAIAMHKFGQINNGMKTFERDVNDMKTDVRSLTTEVSNLRIRVDTHMNVINILTQLGVLGGGESSK